MAAHPIDTHVGSRLRMRREERGMSQTALGDALDISFQQVQKYERGSNRISASKLCLFAHTLAVDVGYFFERLPSSALKARRPRGRGRRST